MMNIRNYLLYNKCFLCHNYLEIDYDCILTCNNCNLSIDSYDYYNNRMHCIIIITELPNYKNLLLEFTTNKNHSKKSKLFARIRDTTKQNIVSNFNPKDFANIAYIKNLVNTLRLFS